MGALSRTFDDDEEVDALYAAKAAEEADSTEGSTRIRPFTNNAWLVPLCLEVVSSQSFFTFKAWLLVDESTSGLGDSDGVAWQELDEGDRVPLEETAARLAEEDDVVAADLSLDKQEFGSLVCRRISAFVGDGEEFRCGKCSWPDGDFFF